jgi:preprotein translocase subunit SecG
METVLIVIHLMVVLALVVVVLLQRSEGGALGMGGGGGGGGFMSARGAANALTKTTSILAAAFFATSIGLGIYAKVRENPSDILNRVPTQTQDGTSILDQITPESERVPSDGEPSAPSSQ